MNISPGIVGLYWLAATAATAACWTLAARYAKRAAHRLTSRCYCGTC